MTGRKKKILSGWGGHKAILLSWFAVFLFAASVIVSGVAWAQNPIIPFPTPRAEPGVTSSPYDLFNPNAPEVFPNEEALLELSATLLPNRDRIETGILWRVYGSETSEDGTLPLIATFTGGEARFQLPAGFYYVNASYGYANQTRRVRVLPPASKSVFDLKAGALRLSAAFRDGDYIPAEDVSFTIAEIENEEQRIIATEIGADQIVRLNEGDYYVTSRYGTVNSEVNANVRVTAGELTDLTLFQRGAEITLKLVSEPGGEAIANTSWTVLTPGGDPIVNTITSAFPSFVLAAGDYIAFARNDGKNHSTSFTVESGVHRDIEILLN